RPGVTASGPGRQATRQNAPPPSEARRLDSVRPTRGQVAPEHSTSAGPVKAQIGGRARIEAGVAQRGQGKPPMFTHYEIGRIAGIPIYLDMWFVLVLLFFAYPYFTGGSSQAVSAGFVIIVGILVSILLHELGHA